jgi:MOSC domain-containing protein YiiM
MMKIVQINVSEKGGMPKTPVDSVRVTFFGLEGDYNEYRATKLNGDLDSAVLILPLKTIIGYSKEGYRVYPGAMGENFTIDGLEYSDIRPEQKYRLGRETSVQITRPCNPCYKLLVYGEDFVKKTQGKRGWYARVLTEGMVIKGDDVVLIQ